MADGRTSQLLLGASTPEGPELVVPVRVTSPKPSSARDLLQLGLRDRAAHACAVARPDREGLRDALSVQLCVQPCVDAVFDVVSEVAFRPLVAVGVIAVGVFPAPAEKGCTPYGLLLFARPLDLGMNRPYQFGEVGTLGPYPCELDAEEPEQRADVSIGGAQRDPMQWQAGGCVVVGSRALQNEQCARLLIQSQPMPDSAEAPGVAGRR